MLSAWRTESSRPKGPPARSWGSEGPQTSCTIILLIEGSWLIETSAAAPSVSSVARKSWWQPYKSSHQRGPSRVYSTTAFHTVPRHRRGYQRRVYSTIAFHIVSSQMHHIMLHQDKPHTTPYPTTLVLLKGGGASGVALQGQTPLIRSIENWAKPKTHLPNHTWSNTVCLPGANHTVPYLSFYITIPNRIIPMQLAPVPSGLPRSKSVTE